MASEPEVPAPTAAANIVLALTLIMSITNQQQRYLIAYADSYCQDKYKDDTLHSICASYSEFGHNYGILSGAAFLIAFACFGIFGGALADILSRKVIICLSVLLWSTTSIMSGLINSFAVFYIMRFLLGLFQAFFNPACYSILSDYFHPQYRTTANAVFNLGIYLGGALASISGNLLQAKGWRQTY